MMNKLKKDKSFTDTQFARVLKEKEPTYKKLKVAVVLNEND